MFRFRIEFALVTEGVWQHPRRGLRAPVMQESIRRRRFLTGAGAVAVLGASVLLRPYRPRIHIAGEDRRARGGAH